MNLTVYLSGEYMPLEDAHVHVEDRGFNFADALYEVARIYNGVPFTFDRHIARMQQGARTIRLGYGYTAEDFAHIVDRLVEENDLSEAFTYIQVSRGRAPRTHPFPQATDPTVLVMVKPHQPMPWSERLAGKKAIMHPDQRYGFCDAKTTALLPNVLACQKAREEGAFEAILVRGRWVTEGSNTNAYIVRDDAVVTYPLVNILPGITRSVIAEICQQAGIPFIEEPFTPGQLKQADEVFVTGSVSEIIPIVEVDCDPVADGQTGPVTRRLIKLYAETVQDECGLYTPRRN